MIEQGACPSEEEMAVEEKIGKLEAMQKIARVAMADLLGASEPPEGVEDKYPFNACAWRDSLPPEWRDEAEAVIRYVYHEEEIPPALAGARAVN